MPTPESRLPNWPPPDGTITVDEARQIIAWIRTHAGPVLEEAEQMLHERYPGAEIEREAVSVGHLVKWGAHANHAGTVGGDGLVFLHGRIVCHGRYRARSGGAAGDQAGDEYAVIPHGRGTQPMNADMASRAGASA